MSRDIFHQSRVLRAPSNLALNPAREVAATASLGSLGQGFTTLMVKNFFLISQLNLPSFSLEPFPLVLSLHPLVKSPSPPFLLAPSSTGSCSKVTPEPSLLQTDQPQLPQLVPVGEVLQPSDHLRGLLQPRSNTSMPFLSWGLQSWTQESFWCCTAVGESASSAMNKTSPPGPALALLCSESLFRGQQLVCAGRTAAAQGRKAWRHQG